MTARVSMLLKSRASLTCFRACFLPGLAKYVSTSRYKNDQGFDPRKGQFFFCIFYPNLPDRLSDPDFLLFKDKRDLFQGKGGRSVTLISNLLQCQCKGDYTSNSGRIVNLHGVGRNISFHFCSLKRPVGDSRNKTFSARHHSDQWLWNVSIILHSAKVKCRKGSSLPCRLNCL